MLVTTVGDAARSSQAARWWLLLVGAWLLLWTGYMAAKTLVLVHATAAILDVALLERRTTGTTDT